MRTCTQEVNRGEGEPKVSDVTGAAAEVAVTTCVETRDLAPAYTPERLAALMEGAILYPFPNFDATGPEIRQAA